MKKIIRRSLGILLSIALLSSCLSEIKSRLDEHESRIAALESLCEKLNTNINSLQTILNAIENNDFVTAVVPVTQSGETIGYTISFSKSGPITIYHGKDGANGKDGADGYSPSIGVRQDSDGYWYWTIDGKWMTDTQGNRIRANGKDGADGANGADGKDGISPKLKIENDYWYISYDNGINWTPLSKAVGKDGDSFFKDFSHDSNNVFLTLADGTVITIPKNPKLSINISRSTVLSISEGESVEIRYELANAGDKPIVTASSDGRYQISHEKTSETEGTLTVTAPTPMKDGFVNIIASDDSGRSAICVINFIKGTIIFTDGYDYQASRQAQTIIIPFKTSYDYKAQVSADCASWMSTAPDTRAMREETLEVALNENDGNNARTGTISILNAINDNLLATITITQDGKFLENDIPGVYNIGMEGLQYRRYLDQIEIDRSAQGVVDFNCIDTEAESWWTVGGIPSDIARDEQVNLSLKTGSFVRYYNTTVLKTDGKTVWLQSPEGPSFIVLVK